VSPLNQPHSASISFAVAPEMAAVRFLHENHKGARRKTMTKLPLICAAAGVVIMLSGCADDRYAYGGGTEIAAGPDIYYDDYYGPFYDGYWGPEGAFYFSESAGRPFHRDDGHHFRREATEGFHHVPPPRHDIGPMRNRSAPRKG
jgi:hypothetical protein